MARRIDGPVSNISAVNESRVAIKLDFDKGALVVSDEKDGEFSFSLASKPRVSIVRHDPTLLIISGVHPETQRPMTRRWRFEKGAESVLQEVQHHLKGSMDYRSGLSGVLQQDELSDSETSFSDEEAKGAEEHAHPPIMGDYGSGMETTSKEDEDFLTKIEVLGYQKRKAAFVPKETEEGAENVAESTGDAVMEQSYLMSFSSAAFTDFSQLVEKVNVTEDFLTVTLELHHHTRQAPSNLLRDVAVEDVADVRFRGYELVVTVKYCRDEEICWRVPTLKAQRKMSGYELSITPERLSILQHEDLERKIPLGVLRLTFATPVAVSKYRQKLDLPDDAVEEQLLELKRVEESQAKSRRIEKLKEKMERTAQEVEKRLPVSESSPILNWQSLSTKPRGQVVRAFYDVYRNIHALGITDDELLSIRDFRLACAEVVLHPDFRALLTSFASK